MRSRNVARTIGADGCTGWVGGRAFAVASSVCAGRGESQEVRIDELVIPNLGHRVFPAITGDVLLAERGLLVAKVVIPRPDDRIYRDTS